MYAKTNTKQNRTHSKTAICPANVSADRSARVSQTICINNQQFFNRINNYIG